MLNSLPVIKSHRGVNTSSKGGVSYYNAANFSVRLAGHLCEQIAIGITEQLRCAPFRETLVGLADYGNSSEGTVILRIVRKLKGPHDATIDLTLQQQGHDLYVEMDHYDYRGPERTLVCLTCASLVALTMFPISAWLFPGGASVGFLCAGPVSIASFGLFAVVLGSSDLVKEEKTASLALRGSVLKILLDTLESFGIRKEHIVNLDGV